MTKDEVWLLKEKYQGLETEEFLKDKERLASGEPLSYLIGHTPFLNTTIYLDSHPLIPRPETEYWVEKAIEEIKKQNEPTVLDLCAGSGVIGVAVAKAIPEAKVTFAEIDKNHLATIGKNLDVNGISCTCYKVFQSDLFENIKDKFDFILTNPPYIDPALDRADDSVKNHEPHLALYGGSHGLEIIERIISEAPQYLNHAGQLWIEHEPEQTAAISELAEKNHYTSTTYTDQYGVERYSVLILK